MNKFKIGLSLLILVLLAIQLIRPDYSAPQTQEGDFLDTYQSPTEISQLIQAGCYDCHSNYTHYPWYSQIAPLSWWINEHVEQGRKELNFSEWGLIEAQYYDEWAKKCAKYLQKYEMPMPSYQRMHPEAQYSEAEREMLIEYFQSLARL
jgi:hypothetical protein